MKSVQSPYPQFGSYYPLEDVIDSYMEIWYQSDSSDSSERECACFAAEDDDKCLGCFSTPLIVKIMQNKN